MLAMRNQWAAYMDTAVTTSGSTHTPSFNLMGEGFTDLSESKNPTEYSRKYIHEQSERTDVTGFAPAMAYSMDYYTSDPVCMCIREITDQEKIGTEMANALIELAGDKELNVLFLGGAASEVINLQYAAVEKALEGHDNIKVIDIAFDDGSAATANQVLTDQAKTHPELNAVVCQNSSAATIGTASFIQENGLEDEWITVGIDASADILNYVKAGALDATINQDFYAMGYNCVKMAYEKIVNGTEPQFINDSGCYLIYPDDVDQYAADNGIDLG